MSTASDAVASDIASLNTLREKLHENQGSISKAVKAMEPAAQAGALRATKYARAEAVAGLPLPEQLRAMARESSVLSYASAVNDGITTVNNGISVYKAAKWSWSWFQGGI